MAENQVATNYSAPVDFRLPANPPSYPSDPALQAILVQDWQTLQIIIQTLVQNCGIASRLSSQLTQLAGSPSTILSSNTGRYYDTATEAIAYGAPINITAGGIQNANATTNAKPADGFCSSVGGIASGAIGEVILATGVITGLAGLVKGTRYFLSTAPGTFQTAKPVAAGNIEQYCGFAINATTLFFTSHYWIQH